MAYGLSDPAHLSLLRRIFYRRWAPLVTRHGLEPDEIYQRVCLSMVIRDGGKHPYSAEKGSRSNYAYMVCRSVVGHAIERQKRLSKSEVLGQKWDAALERGRE